MHKTDCFASPASPERNVNPSRDAQGLTVETFAMPSARDGLPLSVMLVLPRQEPIALMQLAHGMCEHKERYLPFMRFLAGRGIACLINDHRGHGASVRSRDDLGYFYEDGANALTGDLHQLSLYLKERFPGLPLILFGHSMGSLAVRAYCARWDGLLSALIVCGSPGENPAAGAGLLIARLIARLRGERHRSRLLTALTTGAFARRFSKEGPLAWLSVNPKNVREYAADPLCGFGFTVNGHCALMELMRQAYALKPPRANPELPVYFFSGADDPCAPNAAGFQSAMESMRRAGYAHVQGTMFPGLRHEILNEACAAEVYQAMWDAVRACLQTNS